MGEFFSDEGKLGKAKGYESRSGQAKMAERVAQIIEDRRHLVVEAGTVRMLCTGPCGMFWSCWES